MSACEHIRRKLGYDDSLSVERRDGLREHSLFSQSSTSVAVRYSSRDARAILWPLRRHSLDIDDCASQGATRASRWLIPDPRLVIRNDEDRTKERQFAVDDDGMSNILATPNGVCVSPTPPETQRKRIPPSEPRGPLTLDGGSGVIGLGFYSMTRAPTRWKLVRQPTGAQQLQPKREEGWGGSSPITSSGRHETRNPPASLPPFDPPCFVVLGDCVRGWL